MKGRGKPEVNLECPYTECKDKGIVFKNLELKSKHIFLYHIKNKKK